MWLLTWAALVGLYIQKEVTAYQVIHFSILMETMELGSRYLPSCFTVSELFIISALNAYYTGFFFDSLIYKEERMLIPGDNVSNILIFAPWALLNMALLVYVPLERLEDGFMFHFKPGFILFMCTALPMSVLPFLIAPHANSSTLAFFLDETLKQ